MSDYGFFIGTAVFVLIVEFVAILKSNHDEEKAFDVEKVVRELRDLKMRYYFTIANTGDADKDYAYLNTANAIDKAIEIVKRGGRDEE